MQLHVSFLALLAGFFTISATVQAAPLPTKRTNGRITLPLTRVEQRSDLHPSISHQQMINRSQRRYARMTGRAEPSVDELEYNLRKRVLAVEGEEGLTKRYNRVGLHKNKAANLAGTNALIGGGRKNRKNKAAAAGAGAGAVIGAGAGAAKQAAGKGKGGNATGAANSTALPDGVEAANAPTGDNSLGLNIEGPDVGYLATIQMGTPPRNFLILMDSGSADLWVGAENCQSEAGGGCGNHNFLGPQSSSSFQDSKTPFQVTYGTGNVKGSIVQDDISVAGLQLKGHTFGVASQESVEFSSNDTPFDGLMGLAQSTLSEQKTNTPIEALAANGLVQDAITSYKISRALDNKNDGEITFGGLDPAKFDAQSLVTLDNVSKQGFWEADMDAVTVDGQDTGLQGRTAILDTGTTLIIAPAQDAIAVHKLIDGAQSDGQGGFTVPCNTKASIALSFGGTEFAIDPRDIAVQPLDPNDPNGDCISGIASGNIGGAQEWLVGDVFLKNAYFSTDVTKNTLSLAKLV